jgi:MFS family permease
MPGTRAPAERPNEAAGRPDAGGVRALLGELPRPFWFIWAGTLVNRMGSFVLPFMAIYLTEARGLTVAHAGVILALYGAGGAIAAPLGGLLADHVGRRATMLIALALGGVGMISLGFVESVVVLSALFFLVAVVVEMYRPAMSAAIADLVPSAQRPRAYGLVYWAINLGFALGLALGGVLAGVSFRLLFIGDGLATLVFGLLIWRGVPETRPARAPVAHGERPASAWSGFIAPYRDPTFVAFLVLHLVVWLVFMQNNTAMALDMTAHGVSKAAFGLVLGLNGLVIVLIQPLLGPFLTRHDRSRTLATGALLVGLGFGMNAIASSAPVYALGVLVWTIGEICVLPVASTVVADLAPRDVRGRYQGAYGFSFGLATCLAPPLGTLVLQRFGSVPLWSACVALGSIVAAGQLALGPSLRRARAVRMAAG